MDSVNRFGPELILLSAAGIIILADIGWALAGAGAERGRRPLLGGVGPAGGGGGGRRGGPAHRLRRAGRGVRGDDDRRRLLVVLQLPVRGDRRDRHPLVDRLPEG